MTATVHQGPVYEGCARADVCRVRRALTQLLLVVLINVPSLSFGLAMGWVSLESGAPRGGEEEGDMLALVGAAATTFLAGALAMPLAARAVAAGRKSTMLATSAVFIACWSLKLCGGWGVVAGRAAAGLGGAAAWVIPPMLAGEMCVEGVRGAAAVALVLAHNAGFLLMYLAADYDLNHSAVLVWCLALSVLHFVVYVFVPESPAYLAAHGEHKKARAALAWCGGYRDVVGGENAALEEALAALPAPDLEPVSPFRLAKDMLRDRRRCKAFVIALVCVAGQEMCGMLTLLQFAERVFALARAEGTAGGSAGGRPSSDAVVLGAVQLVASALALYLVEKIGRRALLVGGGVGTAVFLGAGGAAVLAGRGTAALVALAAAVTFDSAGLMPAPYALLSELFTYQYRGCAVLLVTACGDLANALEIMVFPALVQAAGLAPALLLAALMTLVLASYALVAVPETRGKSVSQIYEELCPGLHNDHDDKGGETGTYHNTFQVCCESDAEGDIHKEELENDDAKVIIMSEIENGRAQERDPMRETDYNGLSNESDTFQMCCENDAEGDIHKEELENDDADVMITSEIENGRGLKGDSEQETVYNGLSNDGDTFQECCKNDSKGDIHKEELENDVTDVIIKSAIENSRALEGDPERERVHNGLSNDELIVYGVVEPSAVIDKISCCGDEVSKCSAVSAGEESPRADTTKSPSPASARESCTQEPDIVQHATVNEECSVTYERTKLKF